jgi:hypothetical protein
MGLTVATEIDDATRGRLLIQGRGGDVWLCITRPAEGSAPTMRFDGDTARYIIATDDEAGCAVIADRAGASMTIRMGGAYGERCHKVDLHFDGPRSRFVIVRGEVLARSAAGADWRRERAAS